MGPMTSTAVHLAVATTSLGPERVLAHTTTAAAVVVQGQDTDRYITAAHGTWIGSIVVAAVISGVCSYFLVTSILVDVLSVFLWVLGPVVAVQKVKLAQLGTFRQVHNELRHNVNALQQENQTLTHSVEQLTIQSVQLERVQQDLENVAQKSGATVHQLVTVVQANATVQKEILQLLQAQVLEQILTAVLATDADRDFVVDPPEVEILIARLQNLPGMEFDETAFRALVRQTHPPDTLTLPDVLAMARQLQEQTQTLVRRRDIFAPSPRGGGAVRLSPSQNNRLLASLSFGSSGGGDETTQSSSSPRGTATDAPVFGFKPRSLLKNKKVLGLF